MRLQQSELDKSSGYLQKLKSLFVFLCVPLLQLSTDTVSKEKILYWKDCNFG